MNYESTFSDTGQKVADLPVHIVFSQFPKGAVPNMCELFRKQQMNIMMMLISVCALLMFLTLATRSLGVRRRRALLMLELSSMLLMIADRNAYIFRGDISTLGYWMVRVCNYLVYALSTFNLYAFNLYLQELLLSEGVTHKPPRRLRTAAAMTLGAEVIILISVFTGWFYTFDDQNRYVRTDLFVLWYILPLAITVIMLSVIVQYYKKFKRGIRVSLILFSVLPFLASTIQVFTYGISLTNISMVGTVVLLYIFALLDLNKEIDRANKREIEVLRDEQTRLRVMFEQTAGALSSSIDAKDRYTHGHSKRVAEYSERIAQAAGMSKEECEEVYFAALLHDVGKIGIPNNIINKEGRLTDEEFDIIKTHPVIGNQILSSINQSPYLSVGAYYHHERYDGRGYPKGLKGEDIPAIARIIAVADAYDAMTSKRSYRDTLPQYFVREEFVRGTGTQFDPQYAQIMLHFIDEDSEYLMKEREEKENYFENKELFLDDYRSDFSDGILLTGNFTVIRMRCKPEPDRRSEECLPSVILFDSLDGLIHDHDNKGSLMHYYEYGEIRFDGRNSCTGARRMETEIIKKSALSEEARQSNRLNGCTYEIRTACFRDHAVVTIDGPELCAKTIIALNDGIRYAYLGITGEHCTINQIRATLTEKTARPSDIPRIAEEVTFLEGPEGDIPNIEIDDFRSDSTMGQPVGTSIEVRFHAKSLPCARLISHCPFAVLFTSDDKRVKGKNYHEIALVRTDGEIWHTSMVTHNKIVINKNEDFVDWEEWKQQNKQGLECVITAVRNGDILTVTTELGSISTKNVMTLTPGVEDILLALSGDQVTMTDIRIS